MQQVHQELLRMREHPALNVRDLSDLIILSHHGPDDIHACGAFGDIRLATLRDFGLVALKTLSVKGRIQPELRLTKVRSSYPYRLIINQFNLWKIAFYTRSYDLEQAKTLECAPISWDSGHSRFDDMLGLTLHAQWELNRTLEEE